MTPSKMIAECFLDETALVGVDRANIEAWANGTNGEAVISHGIVRTFVLSASKLAKRRDWVVEQLERLPAEFRESDGGGYSFLNASLDGEWQHIDIEALFCMAMSLGLAEYCLPKELWQALPGGLPYVQYCDIKGGVRLADSNR